MNALENRVMILGRSLDGRLPSWQVEFALSYITHGEIALAIETIIDNLCDENVKLTLEEYHELLNLVQSFPSIEFANRGAYLRAHCIA